MGPGRRLRFQSLPDGVHAAHLAGELAGAELSAFEIEAEAAIHRGDLAVVVDLREVTFLDSSGVRFLHRLAHTGATSGTGVRVVSPPGCRSRRVLDIVGMTLLVDDDLDAARAALREPPPA